MIHQSLPKNIYTKDFADMLRISQIYSFHLIQEWYSLFGSFSIMLACRREHRTPPKILRGFNTIITVFCLKRDELVCDIAMHSVKPRAHFFEIPLGHRHL